MGQAAEVRPSEAAKGASRAGHEQALLCFGAGDAQTPHSG